MVKYHPNISQVTLFAFSIINHPSVPDYLKHWVSPVSVTFLLLFASENIILLTLSRCIGAISIAVFSKSWNVIPLTIKKANLIHRFQEI